MKTLHFGNTIAFLKKEYGGNLLGDLSGGLTTAVVALPLALAFAIASGVPARYGLYTAIVTGVVAAVFGGSKVQVTGPTGGMAAVLIAVTTQFGYEKVVLIALMAGAFQILAGTLRLGRFVKMLPFPLVTGFTTGIAIVILGGQLDHVLGLQLKHHHTEFYDRLVESVKHASLYGINEYCLLIAAVSVAVALGLARVSSRLPAALIAILIAAGLTSVLNLEIPRIKDIPRYLPMPGFPAFSWEMFRELLRPAATVAALGAIESLLAAVVADSVLADGSKHDSNRELVGQGLANVAASFFGGIPCTGAIARTAVNIKSGGRTRLAAVFHSLFLLCAMLFFAPLAVHVPIAALAGILVLTSVRMIEWHHTKWLMQAPRSDIAIMAVTVIVTIFTDLVLAVEFGLVAAGILFIKKMSEVPVQIVHDVDANEQSERIDHVRILRLPGPLFWGDSHAVLDALENCEGTKVVILKMQYVSHIDASGMSALREAKQRLDKKQVKLFLVNVPPLTLHTMDRMGMVDEIGKNNIFPSLEGAKSRALACA